MQPDVIVSPSESALSIETFGEEIAKYFDNATKILVEAQTLGNSANTKVTEIKEESSILQQNISKLKFLYNCIEKQLHLLLDIILKKYIGGKVIDTEWSKNILVDLVNLMKYWQDEIDQEIENLSKIKNVLVSNSSEDDKYLCDYISIDDVNSLQDKLLEIPVIQKHISNIRIQYKGMVRRIDEKIANKSLKELKAILEDKFEQNNNNDMLLLNETYPEQLIQLEMDLINFLGSLTAHFDKCQLLKGYLENKGSDNSLDYTGFNNLLEIVRNDDKELNSIFASLCDIIDDIDKCLPEYKHLIESKTVDQHDLHIKMNKVISSLSKNYEYLSIFKDIMNLIDLYKDSCLKEIKTVSELRDFYASFENSYKSLLQEVERRKTYSKEMEQIINDCKTKLETLNDRDQMERRDFLEKHGNFLPENIWPNEIEELTPLYTLDYSIKHL
ncbi:similar to Saccharomyces cerevisiae YLR423C ATG17 Scaffold protein responsible for phagophore assembly site organization [Maudiozyma barnettii]|uniref:Autophagy-related protein 17 n=1 Tax=Maudiozyma barnettii TaxID=61262 RepID=A0A8H2ZIS1_9SACH|nr:protein kinase regulatory subunit ATG17 [Kazachstania barnettii]CAB4256193.1 similar to Saccharomyces cerevisiae YLR423C ATG17 Scaffold protein responsible for phagophore assembly site organization [Kazachstania barnettii]CAD1784801.1 similar to Saccharomyces cerevisiae YLR423C ATG17 Scaffold protein responsible for phagophore assembly site organization [Kazachstania barnettii]